MQYGLIGEKLGHSFSKPIHESMGLYTYEIHEVARDRIEAFMTERPFSAINVTIPYKQDVIPFLKEMTEDAARIGAVNCIVNRNGELYGHNTDIGGMELLLERLGIRPAGKKVLILGTGGTSKTALALCRKLQAREIYRVSRSASDLEGVITYEQAVTEHSDAQVIINTTPSGMYPNTQHCPISLNGFSRLEGVADAVYNPLRTQLVLNAREKGLPAEGGLYMLVAQAVLAAAFFCDGNPAFDLSDEKKEELFGRASIDRIYEQIMDQKESIALIGMPSCGKTTVGTLLAERLGIPLVDTDELIVRKAGMPITEIFAKYGEKHFRDLESEVIREVSETGGKILSLGGGAPLRPENVRSLKRNAKVFFIDRDMDGLVATDSRPLSNNIDKLKALYQVRYPIYQAAADVQVPVKGDAESVADDIIRRRHE